MKNINLVIGNDTCGTCTAICFSDIEQAIETFFDIKKNGRNSAFLNKAKVNNMAGISFVSSELIEVSIDAEDDNGFPLSDCDNRQVLQPAIDLGYAPISI